MGTAGRVCAQGQGTWHTVPLGLSPPVLTALGDPLTPAKAAGAFLSYTHGNRVWGGKSPQTQHCWGLPPPAESSVIAGPGGTLCCRDNVVPTNLPPRRSNPSSSAGLEGDGVTQPETQHLRGCPELWSRLSIPLHPKKPVPLLAGTQGLCMGQAGSRAPESGLAPQSIRGQPHSSQPTSISRQHATVGN